jgi:NADPH:quinone reductase-like Zn-dependent oxidoreductase
MSTTRQVACQGWRFARHGVPDKVLRQEKYRLPFDRKGGQVVVKMLAAPVHAHDKNYIQGTYGGVKPAAFPAVGGSEGVGIVEEVGAGSKVAVREGDLVWINKQNVGTWASHVVTDAENVDVLPNRADLDIEHLSAMSTFHTAYHMINETPGAKLRSGDVALMTGASGSVAQAAMGFAKARGAKLICTMPPCRAASASRCWRRSSTSTACSTPSRRTRRTRCGGAAAAASSPRSTASTTTCASARA